MVGWLPGYLIKSGNLSRGAVQMTGDLPNADGGYYEAFLETLHAIISLFREPQWEMGWRNGKMSMG